jgi:hypothetical protein
VKPRPTHAANGPEIPVDVVGMHSAPQARVEHRTLQLRTMPRLWFGP